MTTYLFRKIHHSFFVIILSVGIICGVALSSFLNLSFFRSPVWLFVAILLLAVNYLLPYFAITILSLIAGFIIGSFRLSLQLGDHEYVAQFIGKTIQVEGAIFEDPDSSDGSTSIRINKLVFGNENQTRSVSGSLYIQFYGSKDLARSDRVQVSGTVSAGFGSFAGTLYNPYILKTSKPDPPDLALEFRNYFGNTIKQFIPEPEVDLSLGYLLGQRRMLPQSFLDTLKTVGLTHIIVASGYNLSVLVRLVRRLFKKVSRFAALLFGLLLIGCFMLMTGFTPSMARAGLVSVLSLFAWYFGRKFHPAKLLILVASATLLMNPGYVQDLGWLLSFASFAGVMLVSPIITAYYYGDDEPNVIAATVIETISAQLCCLPLLLYFFGTFSIVSIVANILILPTIPYVMFLTFATGVSALIVPLATLLGWLATQLLSYHIAVVDFFGNIPWAIVAVSPGNSAVFASYIIIVGAILYLRHKTELRLLDQSMLKFLTE